MVADIEFRLEVGSPAKTRFMPSVGVSGLVGSYEVSLSPRFGKDFRAFGDDICVLKPDQRILSVLCLDLRTSYLDALVFVATLNPAPSFCKFC